MTITVLFFAQARDCAGCVTRTLELPEGSRVDDVVRALRAAHPGLEPLWPHLAVAVDGVLAARDAPVRAGAEIALLPPVSGGSAARPPRRSAAIVFRPLTPERWDDCERLFGPRGACGGCWCMWPRLRGAVFTRSKGDGNRRALKRVVAGGAPPGLLAYAGSEPVGWCALAPRADYPRLAGSRVLAPLDDEPVWSVVCFFVARSHRGRGLTPRLLRAACRYAAARGARIVEGYPSEPVSGRAADAFVWTGLASAFLSAGFREVARRSPTRPIMRRAVRASRAPRRARATLRGGAAPARRPRLR